MHFGIYSGATTFLSKLCFVKSRRNFAITAHFMALHKVSISITANHHVLTGIVVVTMFTRIFLKFHRKLHMAFLISVVMGFGGVST